MSAVAPNFCAGCRLAVACRPDLYQPMEQATSHQQEPEVADTQVQVDGLKLCMQLSAESALGFVQSTDLRLG